MTPLHCGCGKDNDPWRRFCGGCGAALGLGCSTCKFVNKIGDRFCGGCGGVCRNRAVDPLVRKTPPASQRTIPIELAELISEGPSR